MKIPACFHLRHAMLPLAVLSAAFAAPPLCAEDGTGNRPEMAAPDASMAAHAHPVKVLSTALTITLKPVPPGTLPAAGGSITVGDKTLTLSPADLAALPHETVSVINGHTAASETYSGVAIAVLLARLGLPFERANEHTLIKTCLVAEGTDGYRVLISAYETLSTIRGTSAIVADTLNGKPLATDGAFKLVLPGDKRPQRWVQNLKSISFKTLE